MDISNGTAPLCTILACIKGNSGVSLSLMRIIGQELLFSQQRTGWKQACTVW